MSNQHHKNWGHIQWYSDDDTNEERRLILKLDLLFVPFASVCFWLKFTDQANLNNAYVSGMQEDLGFHANELVQLQTFFTVGTVVGQLPFMFLFTRVPLHWLIPFLDICWGVLTLLQYRSQSFGELAAYRFLVGLFQSAYWPAVHYVLGSWYKGDEISRRGGVFYIGQPLGTLTAGLIQAGVSARLDGVHGLAGWRWMYIICAIITLPIGLLGYFLVPGTPNQPNLWALNQTDICLSQERLKRAGHGSHAKADFGTLKKVLLSWHFWAIVGTDTLFWSTSGASLSGSYLLWIKSLHRFATDKINELGTIVPALGILYTLFTCFASDLLLGPAWAITMASSWNALGLLILIIWNVPEAANWFAFATSSASAAIASVLYGWINNQLRAVPAERAVTLVLANAISQSTTSWTTLLVFPTVEAPRYRNGFSFCFACAVLLIVATHLLKLYVRRREARAEAVFETSPINFPAPADAVEKAVVGPSQQEEVS